jgi:hypothetical protein
MWAQPDVLEHFMTRVMIVGCKALVSEAVVRDRIQAYKRIQHSVAEE